MVRAQKSPAGGLMSPWGGLLHGTFSRGRYELSLGLGRGRGGGGTQRGQQNTCAVETKESYRHL